MVARSAAITMPKTRNCETGALVKPEEIIASLYVAATRLLRARVSEVVYVKTEED